MANDRSINPETVKALEGWVTLADAASQMKLSKNGLRKRVFEYGEFPNVRKLGVGTNVIFVLPTADVEKAVEVELREREIFQTERVPAIINRKARAEQRKKIIAWAQEQQFETAAMGRLPVALIAAYKKAHPGEEII